MTTPPKPTTNENGELFEWYKETLTAMCDEINKLPPREREEARRVALTGVAARRLNRGDFTTEVNE